MRNGYYQALLLLLFFFSTAANADIVFDDNMTSVADWTELSAATNEEGDSVGGIRIVDYGGGPITQMNSWWDSAEWTQMYRTTGVIINDQTDYTARFEIQSYSSSKNVDLTISYINSGIWTEILTVPVSPNASSFNIYTVEFSTVSGQNSDAVGDEIGITISPGSWNNLAIRDIKIESAVMMPAGLASEPSPADKSTGAGVDTESGVDVLLSFKTGTEEDSQIPDANITGHYLYIHPDNADFNGVAPVNLPVTGPNESYGPVCLDYERYYYWRVDESINNSAPSDAQTRTGAVWSFRTASQYVDCVGGSGGDIGTSAAADITVTVDFSAERQQMKTFGASDCWTGQYIGNWPDAKRNAIADLLFETGLDSNYNPKGAGLSAWRFNIGSGSVRNNYITNPWRKADTFLSLDYSGYDWWRLPGQRWFLQAAKARGVDTFLAFCNSPPINMTKNGKAFCDTSSGSTNLAADKLDDFAVYLADIMEHFQNDEGITFTYLSPFNEPQWDWEGTGQEGCRYSNQDIKDEVDLLYAELQSRGLATELMTAEAGSIKYLYGQGSYEGEQIDLFFDTGSSLYMADKLSNQINAHSYWTDTPARGLVPERQALRSKLDQYPEIEYHESEYCHLNDWGSPRDVGMDPALQMARVIHFDLTIAEAVSWEWWLGISCYNYNDGLVYVDKNETDGNYYDSKSLWVFGNFSRFIRPGMYRIDLTRSDNPLPEDTDEGLMISAYKNTGARKIVLVFVNYSASNKIVDVNCVNLPDGFSVKQWIPYVTSSAAADDLAAYNLVEPNENILIKARSVTTLVGSYSGISIVQQPVSLWVSETEQAKFTTGADSAGCRYQWYKYVDGISDIAVGTDSNEFIITSVSESDQGNYYCQISNAGDVVKTNNATLTIKKQTGYWKFNNDLTDSTGSGYDGDDGGAGNYDSNGIEGQAYEFYGDGNVVTVTGSSGAFNFYTIGFSVNAWINFTATDYWMGVASKHDKNANPRQGWILGVNNRKPYITVRNINDNLVGDTMINDGQWHMVTAVYDSVSGMLILYLDGKLDVQSGPAFAEVLSNSEPLVFGANDSTGGAPYKGKLDEVQIYNYPLNANEIAVLYTNLVNEYICLEPPVNDFDFDCDVDFADFSLFAAGWVTQNDESTLDSFSGDWLDCTLIPNCHQ